MILSLLHLCIFTRPNSVVLLCHKHSSNEQKRTAPDHQTHGIRIEPLELDHPTEVDVTMQLNAWDFGVQEIYHATHQFFLSNRSIFVVTWNARHGYEQGKLYCWLDAIQARDPESPVLIEISLAVERLPVGPAASPVIFPSLQVRACP